MNNRNRLHNAFKLYWAYLQFFSIPLVIQIGKSIYTVIKHAATVKQTVSTVLQKTFNPSIVPCNSKGLYITQCREVMASFGDSHMSNCSKLWFSKGSKINIYSPKEQEVSRWGKVELDRFSEQTEERVDVLLKRLRWKTAKNKNKSPSRTFH